MNNKRKNRPGPPRYFHDRPQRGGGRAVQAQGIYNNIYFMPAVTSLVGSLVQVQTHSGSIYEGVFKTFSSNFDVVIQLAQCIKLCQNQTDDTKSSLAECMIFSPDQIVSIVSKEIDLEFATGGTFQTDSAISSKCNGSTRLEEKELEPWDPTGGSVNGDIDLELDGNSNGWDANEMFNKNKELYGVQTTYDSTLAGYTVPIEKKDTQDYKDAEKEAEKIAQEIENHPTYKERTELENGDEEALYAAVERPPEQSPDISPTTTISNTNSNTMSKGTSSVDKYVVLPSKRKNMQTGKIVRSTPPPNNNNGPLSQHNSHSNSKNNNYQPMQMQSTPQYVLNQSYSHMHGHQSNMSQSKMNGEGNNNSSNNKPMSQRGLRQYPQQSTTPVSYTEQNTSMGGQMSMGKPPSHVSHNHSHVSGQHISNSIQETAPQAHSGHMVVQQHHVVISGANMGSTPSPSQPPPQPQRQPRAREEQFQELRKFQQDFHLAGSNQQQQGQINQVKTPSVSPHQQPQPSLSPPQQQHQLSPMTQHPQQPPPSQPPHHQHHQQHQQHQQQQQQPQQQQPPPQPPQQQTQHSQQQQTDNSPPIQSQKSSQSHMQQTEQQNYQPLPQQQQQSPPTIISPSSSTMGAPASTTPPQQPAQQIVNTSSNNSNETNTAEKTPAPNTVTKKTHVLNPAAKPFTPRSPSTPNPSRPHTPQTPGPAMTPGVYTQGPHVAAGQVAYVMQPHQSFQTAPHPHATQRGGLRRGPITASPMQVTAATGQPLLTAAPLQPLYHYQQPPHPPPFQSQPYQPMVRMYHEPPPQQIQFLAQTPPSTTPSPGQPHQQFHPGPQPSPAGGGPPAFGPASQPPHHYQMVCPVIASHPQLVPNYYQGAAQTPHHAQQFQVIMQQQHPAQ